MTDRMVARWVKFPKAVIDAVNQTVPNDVPEDVWVDMHFSAKLRKVVRDWFRLSGFEVPEEPTYKKAGRPKGLKDRRPRRRRTTNALGQTTEKDGFST